LGKLPEIHKIIDECWERPPVDVSPGWVILGAAQELRVQGQFKIARDMAGRASEWYCEKTDTTRYRFGLAEAYRYGEKWQAALTRFEALSAEYPDDLEYLGKVGILSARLGDEKRAREIFKTLEQIDRPYLFGEHTYWRACISSQLQEQALAVTLLRKALDQGLLMPNLKWSDIALEPLRDYQPFQELIRPKRRGRSG
jgi:tetratricopeptide (TPR) repeat protein